MKTAAFMEDLFKPTFSPQQSNRRFSEEEAAFFWITFLGEIEEAGGILDLQHANTVESGDAMQISFEDILIFATGSAAVPPMGFSPMPSLEFSDDIGFPSASTCSNTLTLPLHLQYDTFKHNLVYGILNSPGFMAM